MKTKTIKEALSRLEDLIKYFEESNEQFDLDAGLKNYEEAMKIVDNLQKELSGYELKITEIQKKYRVENSLESQKTDGEAD